MIGRMDDALTARLRAAGCVFAEDEARLLAQAASGPELDALVARRVAGEPLELVLGWAEFAGLRIAVEPGVFVPRRRTELLAELAVTALSGGHVAGAPGPAGTGGVLVDLCCGSGAVAAAVVHAVAGVAVHAADLDPVAVRCAARNLPGHHVHVGDLDAPLPADLRGRVDVLVANTPYVPTSAIATMPPEARDHEPASALDGGPDGLAVARRVAAAAPRWLRPGGTLLIEASTAQAPDLAAVFTAGGFTARVVHDPERDATAVAGVRAG